MSINKTKVYKLTERGLEAEKQKPIKAIIAGKKVTIKPDNPFYTVVLHYGQVI